jgi:putative membrane protein
MSLLYWDQKKKIKWATAIAVVFHLVGFAGMMWIDLPGFAAMTPANLILSLVLIYWTHENPDYTFLFFFFLAFTAGMFAEYLGVNKQLIFGHYQYEDVLGPKLGGVPWMIGVNWFMVIYSCGITVQTLWNLARKNNSTNRNEVELLVVILMGALLAMLFDWLMEPVAIKLGYWTWLAEEGIPSKNYWDWFFVSAFLMMAFKSMGFSKKNQFALHLLLIQILFFLLLRIFLQ